MRLHEVAGTDNIMYKGVPKTPDIIPDDAFEQRTAELRQHLAGWKKAYKSMPAGEPGTVQTEYRIKDMEQELADFEEIGELPFTFYAAKDRDHAEYFQAQFPDGVIDEVRLTAKNLATVEDLRYVGFPMKRTVSHLTPIMIHKLKKAGFDGATGPIDNIPAGEEVVVFSPEQVTRV